MDENIRKQDCELLDKALEIVSEHFDSVIIIATRHEETEGGTIMTYRKAGNYYASKAAVRDWLVNQDQSRLISILPPE